LNRHLFSDPTRNILFLGKAAISNYVLLLIAPITSSLAKKKSKRMPSPLFACFITAAPLSVAATFLLVLCFFCSLLSAVCFSFLLFFA